MKPEILPVLRAVSEDKKRLFAVIIAVLAVFSILAGVVGKFIILLLSIISLVVAFFIGELELKKFGIELVTFTIVLAGFSHGPILGGVLGAVLLTLHFILSRSLGPYVVYCVPVMGMIGMMAGYIAESGWANGDIMIVGASLSVVYNLITASLGSLLLKDFAQEIIWSGTNILINFFLFWKIAPIILSLIV